MSDIIISEFLCVLQNKFGNIPSFNLQNLLVGFFNENEIRASKTLFMMLLKSCLRKMKWVVL